jgi:hypothetical protein
MVFDKHEISPMEKKILWGSILRGEGLNVVNSAILKTRGGGEQARVDRVKLERADESVARAKRKHVTIILKVDSLRNSKKN